MMKRKYIIWGLALLLAVLVGVGAAYAYFTASSRTLDNTFTVGKVAITLTETTGSSYLILPGAEIGKDPRLCVKAESEDCWLFVKVEKTGDFDSLMTYTMAEGWTALAGKPGVWYRAVEGAAADQSFAVLQNDRILVRDTVTEEQLKALGSEPTLKFYGYAIQSEAVPTAAEGWAILEAEEE